MASNEIPGLIPATSFVQGGQAAKSVSTQTAGGKSTPPAGKNVPKAALDATSIPGRAATDPAPTHSAASAANTAPAARTSDPQPLVNLLNKYLNDSGRPDQYRVDPNSGNKLIQEINPATGDVIGEFSVSEFPALARSIGATGLLVDSRA